MLTTLRSYSSIRNGVYPTHGKLWLCSTRTSFHGFSPGGVPRRRQLNPVPWLPSPRKRTPMTSPELDQPAKWVHKWKQTWRKITCLEDTTNMLFSSALDSRFHVRLLKQIKWLLRNPLPQWINDVFLDEDYRKKKISLPYRYLLGIINPSFIFVSGYDIQYNLPRDRYLSFSRGISFAQRYPNFAIFERKYFEHFSSVTRWKTV